MVQVEAIDRFEQAAETLLQQVTIRDTPVSKSLGDMGDEPQIGQGKLPPQFGVLAIRLRRDAAPVGPSLTYAEAM